jgi:hypothetical protein
MWPPELPQGKPIKLPETAFCPTLSHFYRDRFQKWDRKWDNETPRFSKSLSDLSHLSHFYNHFLLPPYMYPSPLSLIIYIYFLKI